MNMHESGTSLLELLLFMPMFFAVFFTGVDLALYASQQQSLRSELAIYSLSEIQEKISLDRNALFDLSLKDVTIVFSESDGRLLSLFSVSGLSKEEREFTQELLANSTAPHPWAKRKLHRISSSFSPTPFYSERAGLILSFKKERRGFLKEFTSNFANIPEFVFAAQIIPK